MAPPSAPVGERDANIRTRAHWIGLLHEARDARARTRYLLRDARIRVRSASERLRRVRSRNCEGAAASDLALEADGTQAIEYTDDFGSRRGL
jgi:hypothetical protein